MPNSAGRSENDALVLDYLRDSRNSTRHQRPTSQSVSRIRFPQQFQVHRIPRTRQAGTTLALGRDTSRSLYSGRYLRTVLQSLLSWSAGGAENSFRIFSWSASTGRVYHSRTILSG